MQTASAAAQRLLSPLAIAGAVAAVCLAATAAVWHGARAADERDRAAAFDYQVRELVNSLAMRMQTYLQVLYGVQGLYASSELVDRREFRTYLERQELHQHYMGLQGVGYMQLVAGSQRAAHIAAVRAEGFPDYTISPPGERSWHAPIVYLEPFSGSNLRAFGFDPLSEPVRRAALQQARDSGLPSMTGRITLRQEVNDPVQAGFLVVLPVYQNGAPHQTLAQRRAALRGWVYSPFRIGDVMAGIGADHTRGLDIEIYDDEQVNPATRMYDSVPALLAAEAARHTLQKISIAGHRWSLQIGALPAPEGVLSDKPELVGLGGLLLSALLTVLAYLLAESRQRARLALVHTRQLARELKEGQGNLLAMAENAHSSQAVLRSILDSTVDGILVDNYRGGVLNSNRRFRQLWNVPEQLDWQQDGAVLLAHMAGQLQQPEPWRRAAAATAHDDEERRMRLQLQDGRVLEQTTRGLRLANEAARLWSFRDITERTLGERREEIRRQVLDSVVRGVEAGDTALMCSIMLLDEDEQHLLVAAAPSMPAFFNAAIHGQPIGGGIGSCGKAVRDNCRVIVEDISRDPLWAPYRDLAARAGVAACCSEPIRGTSGKVLGTFAIYHRQAHRPSVANLVQIEQASHLAGIAIEQAQAAHALRAGEARFRSLVDNAPVALWQQDWSAVRQALAELEQSGVEDVAAWLQNNPSQLQRLANLVRITDANAAALEQVGAAPDKPALAALTMAQNFDASAMPAFARALSALAQGAHLHVCEGSYLRLDGVARRNELTLLVMPGHEHSLDFVIVSTVDITERKRLNEELLRLATTDFLTGLPNRRAFMAHLDDEQARLQRDVGGRAAVLMLDIDHFKRINDSHGHAVGDAVLRHLASLMRDSQRKIDTLGRVGGEEFAALLPGADLDAARAFAERLRQRIADTPLQLEGYQCPVTVSVGIAAMNRADTSGDAALIRADKALYSAKRAGRNRVAL
jgi:diguanylate cyclase (GGDEF)-like protein